MFVKHQLLLDVSPEIATDYETIHVCQDLVQSVKPSCKTKRCFSPWFQNMPSKDLSSILQRTKPKVLGILEFVMKVRKYLVIHWRDAFTTFVLREMLKATAAKIRRIEWTTRRIQDDPGSQHLLANHAASFSISTHPNQAWVCISEGTIHLWVQQPGICKVHEVLNVTLPNKATLLTKRYSVQVAKAGLHGPRTLLFQLNMSSLLDPLN